MNLLIITSNLPYPLTFGGNQAQFNMIDFLRNQNHISLIFNVNKVNSKKNYDILKKKWTNVEFYPYLWRKEKDRKSIFLNKLNNIFQKYFSKNDIFQISDTYPYEGFTESFFSFVNNVINQKKIDIVQIDFEIFLPIVYGLPKNVKKVFIQHEIKFVRNELLLGNVTKTSLQQQFIYNKMKSDEIAAMNHYDMVVTLTEVDKQKLQDNGGIVPLVCSPAAITSSVSKTTFISCVNRLVFVGSSLHYPNYHGLKWFLDFSWKIIQDYDSGIQLDIIGKWDEKIKKHFKGCYKNINFLGFVDDLGSVLNGAIMIVPILIGSGMRMKLMDAASLGCPFVSTSVGVEGLSFKAGEDCFIEDDYYCFAEKIIKLIKDSEKQKIFSDNIKKIFEYQYSKEVLCAKRQSIFNNC